MIGPEQEDPLHSRSFRLFITPSSESYFPRPSTQLKDQLTNFENILNEQYKTDPSSPRKTITTLSDLKSMEKAQSAFAAWIEHINERNRWRDSDGNENHFLDVFSDIEADDIVFVNSPYGGEENIDEIRKDWKDPHVSQWSAPSTDEVALDGTGLCTS